MHSISIGANIFCCSGLSAPRATMILHCRLGNHVLIILHEKVYFLMQLYYCFLVLMIRILFFNMFLFYNYDHAGCGGTGNIMCAECGGRGHLGPK